MTYTVKEIFYSLQGEGARTGRAAVFCRFSGCNLWSGRAVDRASAQCRFCDTDFLGNAGAEIKRFSDAVVLVAALAAAWPGGGQPYVVCTGGEPLLQVDAALIDALHTAGFEIALETNGTLPVPPGIDWICVSPKAGVSLAQRQGDELKFVYPQEVADPRDFESLSFAHFFLQPMDGPALTYNTQRAVEYCLAHPRWRLSLQIHKYLNIP
ncbi:7-carboxy-7-deazaguanine synthase [Gammaproteobacteria bacterium]